MVTFEEKQGVIKALEVSFEQLSKIEEDPGNWIWTIIAMHNALQGLMVLALHQGSGANVMSTEQAEKFLKFLDLPDEKQTTKEIRKFVNLNYLKKFMSLYEDIQSDKMKRLHGSKAFEPKGTQTESVDKLNYLRNDFIHFFPKTLIVTGGELIQMIEDCVAVMAFLIFESGNIMWHREEVEKQAQNLINDLKIACNDFKQS